MAFNPPAAVAGTGGGILMTMLWGIKRGLYSNEAGQGSAAIAHSTAKTKHPVREGAVAMLGPFIDTLIICHFKYQKWILRVKIRGYVYFSFCFQ